MIYIELPHDVFKLYNKCDIIIPKLGNCETQRKLEGK